MRPPRVTTRTRTSRAVALACLVTGAAITWNHAPAAHTDDDARVVDVLARRFAFEPAEIEAVVGERLRLLVRSGDGVHGLEIKRFRIKQDIPRGGDSVAIEFTPTTEGRFPIICSEYCGTGHDDMRGMLVVRTASSGQP